MSTLYNDALDEHGVFHRNLIGNCALRGNGQRRAFLG